MLGESGAALLSILLNAFTAVNDSAKSADDADEGPTVGAGVTFGCTFLVAAGTTNHRISFAERLGHQRADQSLAVRLQKRRNRQSTSWTAFHNALGSLEPCRQSVRSRLLPFRRHRCEATLFAFALETQPAVAVFGCHHYVTPKRTPATIRGVTAVRQSAGRIGFCPVHSTIHLAPLGRSRCHEPDLPAPSGRVSESPITQRRPPCGFRVVIKSRSSAVQSRCQKRH